MEKTVNKIAIGSVAVIIAALFWSLDGTFLTPHLNSLSSVLVVFLEHALGFVVLLPFLILYRSQLKTVTKKQWLAIFWVALFGGALGSTFMTKALFLTGFKDISVVILLQKFQPLFAIILAAIILHERFPRKFYAYASLAVIAGYFVTFKNPLSLSFATGTFWVVILSLLAAFSWGSSTTFGKYTLKNINHGLLAALRFGFTVLIMLLPAMKYFDQLPQVASLQWGILAIIVFTSGSTAMFIYYYGLKRIPASVATLCELSWPVSAIIFDYFLNHNILSPTQLLGAAVLIFAVYKATMLNQPKTIEGVVMEGNARGTDLGARTANLDVGLAKKISKGLYACTINLGDKNYRGLLFYGFNSVSGKDCLEVHIMDFSQNIYGQKITVTTERYLRPPMKFKDAATLSLQIKKDLEDFSKVLPD